MPLRSPPAPPFIRHERKRALTAPTPPAALTLVAATYEGGAYVELTFDRAVDIAALDASAVVVSDGDVTGFQYAGTAESFLVGPTVLRVMLAAVEEGAEPGVTMTAGAGNGVVASGDGAAWAGVSALELPFG
jgi:hypothetical protein